jgi:tellurite resistance protein
MAERLSEAASLAHSEESNPKPGARDSVAVVNDLERRKAMYRLAAGLVLSDDDFDDDERIYLDALIAKLGLGRGDRELALGHVSVADQVHELDREAQEEALQLMLDAAVADGKVFYQERSYLYEVGSAMGLSSAEMDKRISERLAQPRE